MKLLDTFQNRILQALSMRHRPEAGRSAMYQGTVADATVEKRRARNKVARRSRRINRLASQR